MAKGAGGKPSVGSGKSPSKGGMPMKGQMPMKGKMPMKGGDGCASGKKPGSIDKKKGK